MKKHFPPGTFIATPLRVLAIIQLCVAFTSICWILGYPFLGEIYEKKVATQKYELVLKDPLFDSLPQMKQSSLLEGYETLQEKSPFKTPLLPLYMYLWIFLSFLLPLFILLRIEGSLPCALLLPLLLCCGFFEEPRPVTEEEKLFPSEEYLITHYVKRPLSGGIMKQRDELGEAWNSYLLDVWDKPLLFNVARLEAMEQDIANKKYESGFWFPGLIWSLLWAISISYFSRSRQLENNLVH